MRTIKFKAKSIKSGEWLEGDLVQKLNGKYISIGGIDFHEVVTNTISEYTGITDIRGNYVYENDIILFEEKRYKVVWNKTHHGYYLSPLYDNDKIPLSVLNGKEYILENRIMNGGEESI